jgi:hypothetical protein
LVSRLRGSGKNGHSIDFDVPVFKNLTGQHRKVQRPHLRPTKNKKALSELRRRPLSSELF